jgi:hypothetical protein
MPWYTRTSYSGPVGGVGVLTDLIRFEQPNNEQAIEHAAAAAFIGGTTYAELLDETDGFICEIELPHPTNSLKARRSALPAAATWRPNLPRQDLEQ